MCILCILPAHTKYYALNILIQFVSLEHAVVHEHRSASYVCICKASRRVLICLSAGQRCQGYYRPFCQRAN